MCTVLLPPGVNPIAVNKHIYMIHRSRSAVQSIRTTIQDGRPRNHGSVPGWLEGNKFFSSSVRPDRLWDQPAFYLTRTECPPPTGKATVREAIHTHLVPKAGISGGLPPLSLIPPLRPRVLFYFYLYFTVAEFIPSH